MKMSSLLEVWGMDFISHLAEVRVLSFQFWGTEDLPCASLLSSTALSLKPRAALVQL